MLKMHPKKLLPTLPQALFISFMLTACVSGPFKVNQSGKSAEVVDSRPLPVANQTTKPASYQVLIIPSGAIKTSYISDKTSTVGGFLGSMVVGPVAGIVGSLAGSTAGGAAASSAEEAASKNIDSKDIAQAIAPVNLTVYLSEQLIEQLKSCGIEAVLYPETFEPTQANWTESHLTLPASFRQSVMPYRFFMQAGVTNIKLRSGLKDDTLEGAAFVRVYETQRFKQIGRYTYSTGTTGSITLNHYNKKTAEQTTELAQSSKAVTHYLASGIGTDMCAIMKKF